MSSTEKLQGMLETNQCVDVLSLKKFLGVVCEEDAVKIRAVANLHWPMKIPVSAKGYLFSVMVPVEVFQSVVVETARFLTVNTLLLLWRLKEENGPSFYIKVDCG